MNLSLSILSLVDLLRDCGSRLSTGQNNTCAMSGAVCIVRITQSALFSMTMILLSIQPSAAAKLKGTSTNRGRDFPSRMSFSWDSIDYSSLLWIGECVVN